eukprot:TRINITY_DN17873_c1_g2_i1.p1 TRINITY_DN17873_c1_g2~~TRINITY_DN17873_c1_g2_i1.p1  ORF type:complete len:366 (+),score=49.28 TRINITY_DN17873_c1_g2_i1:83-1180(+)
MRWWGWVGTPIHVDAQPMNPKVQNRTHRKFIAWQQKYATVEGMTGQGGFSKVYKGIDANGGRMAIKQLHLGKNTKPGIDATLMWELRALADVKHKNVVELATVVFKIEPMSLLMFLPYYCTDLASFLNRRVGKGGVKRHLSEPLLASLASQLIRGVAAIHGAGYFHRDLKPANIMADDNGVVKIIDFGWSRNYRSPVRSLMAEGIPGTPCYRAPEVLFGVKAYSPAFDLWSLGCILAEFAVLTIPLIRLTEPLGPRDEPFQGNGPLLGTMAATLGIDPSYPPPTLPGYTDFQRLIVSRGNSPPYSTHMMSRLVCEAPQTEVHKRVLEAVAALVKWNPTERPDACKLLEALGMEEGVDVAVVPLVG